ncbi:MAG TPA: hypothetical protein VLD35_08470 [Caldimonas sp.]|nr:hypothetical protein [Caldimonas sp.]
MKTLMRSATSILAMTMASWTFAATQGTDASNNAPDGYATKAKSIGKKKVDAQAEEDQRMSKCQAMKGDEKKGCEANARTRARKAVQNEAPAADHGISKR